MKLACFLCFSFFYFIIPFINSILGIWAISVAWGSSQCSKRHWTLDNCLDNYDCTLLIYGNHQQRCNGIHFCSDTCCPGNTNIVNRVYHQMPNSAFQLQIYFWCVKYARILIYAASFVFKAENLEINPLYMLIPPVLSTSMAFMLPIATPPNAIAFGYGHLKIMDTVSLSFLE